MVDAKFCGTNKLVVIVYISPGPNNLLLTASCYQ